MTSSSSKEEQLLATVLAEAQKGSPESVLSVIDRFGWSKEFLMNVGDEKGAIVDRMLEERVFSRPPVDGKRYVFVEFGGYCGYSAVRIGRLLREACQKKNVAGKMFSIEMNPVFAGISTKILEFAGLQEWVAVVVGTVADQLMQIPSRCERFGGVDFVFIDHWKDMYLKDFRILESSGFLKKGSVVVADNIIYPGAPDYAEYVRHHGDFVSEFHEAKLEYSKTQADGLEVSVFQGR